MRARPDGSKVEYNQRALTTPDRLNHYQILGQLGKGGMGEVFLAEDTRLHRRIAIKVLGLESRIDTREADLNDDADCLRTQNPPGKIPTLVLEDGTCLYDSRVILHHLDHLAGRARRVLQAGA